MTTPARPRTALICVDVQADFLPGGALAVPDGDEVIEPLLAAARDADLIVASRDWHPADHSSFAAAGGSWPPHCVADSRGAALDSRIAALATRVIDKATERDRDAYSAFEDTGLAKYLRGQGIERVLVGGLATDYCVKATVLDAVEAGFETIFLAEAARAVNVEPGDETAAITVMREAGAEVRERATMEGLR